LDRSSRGGPAEEDFERRACLADEHRDSIHDRSSVSVPCFKECGSAGRINHIEQNFAAGVFGNGA
jgi:hypothetical protein